MAKCEFEGRAPTTKCRFEIETCKIKHEHQNIDLKLKHVKQKD
jgi:hypothetical protein